MDNFSYLQRKRPKDVLLEMYYICCFLNNQFDNKDQKSTGILISSENVTMGLNLENVYFIETQNIQ